MHRIVIMDTKTINNKCKKHSLLMCFKPIVPKDKSFNPNTKNDQTIINQGCTYIRVEDKNGDMLPELSSAYGGRRENSKDIWRALKGALKLASLMKKINNKRKVKKYNLSRQNSILDNGTYGVEDSSRISKFQRTNSNISSSYGSSYAFTSSPSLTSSSSSRTDQSSSSLDSSHENETKVTNQKQYSVKDNIRKTCYGSSYISMFMFFISLFVLIMWGKVFAILYTTIWFYVMPPSPCNERDLSKENRFDSVPYNKENLL
ncbi:PREDICTED: uncharacterized protein LOC109334572 [Lupinus angustifolius]|uniref:uncharacterized protein LOC109334572 n=1 Tax=Lupinus angustifolius TaxID=3871 RepID=UPI00092EA82D|nr:PREDICTED: uncharacterized protein LOC109334572 [Lupinus angustifolius]